MYTRRKFVTSAAIAAAGLSLVACRDSAQAGPQRHRKAQTPPKSFPGL